MTSRGSPNASSPIWREGEAALRVHRRWSAGNATGRITRPLRHNGESYTGMNVLLLWSEGLARGFTSPNWMTFRQSIELGGHVRKGETGSAVIYASRFTKTETDEHGGEVERDIPFLKTYNVFNVEQIGSLPEHFYRRPTPILDPVKRIEHADRFFANTGSVIRHGGSRAFYSPSSDHIQMPIFASFRDAASYVAVLGHEHIQDGGFASRRPRSQPLREGSQ